MAIFHTYKRAYQQGQEARANGWERRSPYEKCVAEGYWYAGFDDVEYRVFDRSRPRKNSKLKEDNRK